MFALFRSLFKPLPKIGEIYVFDDCGDPWGSHKVEVLDVANGWVRYKFCDSDFYQDLRTTKSAFNYCYVKMANDNG